MSITHLILFGIIAIIVIPPEKLPEAAKQLAKFLNEMRRMTSGIWDDLKKDAVLKPEDFMKQNPKPPSHPPPGTHVPEVSPETVTFANPPTDPKKTHE